MAARTYPTLEQRLAAGYEPQPNGCWEWMRYRDACGYGRIKGEGNTSQLAHRVMMLSLGHEIADGMEVDHLCRNRACVNPDHLEIVTKRVNALRSASCWGVNHRKTECASGHPFNASNTRVRADGSRTCRACERKWSEKYRQRRSA